MALACSPDRSRGPDESCLALPASCTRCDHLQVFEELDKLGRSLTEEAQDGGFPVHDGKGDLRKCPYYADKLGRSWATTAGTRVWHKTGSTNGAFCVLAGKAGPGCPYQAAVALAKQPLVQLILAACVAVAAGAAAWYLM